MIRTYDFVMTLFSIFNRVSHYLSGGASEELFETFAVSAIAAQLILLTVIP
jgi:hypothetical protein